MIATEVLLHQDFAGSRVLDGLGDHLPKGWNYRSFDHLTNMTNLTNIIGQLVIGLIGLIDLLVRTSFNFLLFDIYAPSNFLTFQRADVPTSLRFRDK